eukprot:30294-Pelagococcus_subviridis.AAC.111
MRGFSAAKTRAGATRAARRRAPDRGSGAIERAARLLTPRRRRARRRRGVARRARARRRALPDGRPSLETNPKSIPKNREPDRSHTGSRHTPARRPPRRGRA